ncbi:MAG: Gfo/Idh/MocA family oxidoreductase, partial [Spirochaetales bacterium]|nr:Gfo/Idh/MocA family oxidoreductase [Spirochaetales bacterium]
MEESKLKWGIIGAGIIAQKMTDALRQNRDSELIAIASKSAEKAAIFAERNRVPISCSYDEIVNNNDIDVIYVATTHNFHFENVKLAMEHGKHVLVEKAFTVNGEEAEELAAIAKGNNLFLMEAIWVRFLPSYKLLKKKLTEGIVGDVKQSIYGFREADPTIINDCLKEFVPLGLHLCALNDSYRSAPVVLDYVNSVFRGMMNAWPH